MTSSSPYNITISSDSPTITYLPYIDGPVAGGWNMSCSDSDPSTYLKTQIFCSGVASRRTSFIGASFYIDFQGTAAYLYGTGDASSFTFNVDGQVRNDLISSPSSGILAKVEGLTYGRHNVSVSVTQSNSMISFEKAVLTIAVGQQDSTEVRNSTMVPFNQDSSDANSTFFYTGTWTSSVLGAIGTGGDTQFYPRQTAGQNSDVTFQISQTSAFFVYGIVNIDLGPFSVTLTPPVSLGPPITTSYNSNAHYINLDRVMYWTSGLDRNQVYSVKIDNLGQGATPFWVFSHIDLLDGGLNSTGGSDLQPTHHKTSEVGPIAGAAAGGSLTIILLIVGWMWYRKRNGTKASTNASNLPYTYTPPQQLTNHGERSLTRITPFTASIPGSSLMMPLNSDVGNSSGLAGKSAVPAAPVAREQDAGAMSLPEENAFRLPPDYNDSWTSDRAR